MLDIGIASIFVEREREEFTKAVVVEVVLCAVTHSPNGGYYRVITVSIIDLSLRKCATVEGDRSN